MSTKREERVVQLVLQAQQPQASLKDLEKASAALNAQLKIMPRNTAEFAAKTKEFQDINKKLSETRQEIKGINTALEQTKVSFDNVGKRSSVVGSIAGATSGFNNLNNAVTQVTREMPAFTNSVSTGFMAISNNLPIFFDAINSIKRTNEELRLEGKETKSVLSQLGSAFFSWNTGISIGITLLTVYGKQFVDFVGSLFTGEETLKSVNDALSENDKKLTEIYRKQIDLQLKLRVARKEMSQEEADAQRRAVDLRTDEAKENAEFYMQKWSIARDLGFKLDAEGKRLVFNEYTQYDEKIKAQRKFNESTIEITKQHEEKIIQLRKNKQIEDEISINDAKNAADEKIRKAQAAEEKKASKLREKELKNEEKKNEEIVKLRQKMLDELFDLELSEMDKELVAVDRKFNKMAEDLMASNLFDEINKAKLDVANAKARQEIINKYTGKSTGKFANKDAALMSELDAIDANTGWAAGAGGGNIAGLSEKDREKISNAQLVSSNIVSIWNSANNTIKSNEETELNKERQRFENKKKHWDELLKHKTITQSEYNKMVSDGEVSLDKKEREMRISQAKREKSLNIFSSIINTASAVVEALPNVPLSILAGVTGGIQTGIIASQPIPAFAEGGPTISAGGAVSQPTLAWVGEKGSEYVVPNWMIRDPNVANTVEFLERYRRSGSNVKAFADGGHTDPKSLGAGTDITSVIEKNTAVLNMLMNNGVKGVWDWDYYNRSKAEINHAKKN